MDGSGDLAGKARISALAGLSGRLRAPWIAFAGCLALAFAALAAAFLATPAPLAAAATSGETLARHMGVASCAGSTCHGHSVPDGTPVRQDELRAWQEPSSPTGAHSRAYAVIAQPRGAAIVRKLGLGADGVREQCLGCHASAGGVRLADGVDCESCHGGAAGWLAAHYTVGASHRRNVAQGMTDLTDPRTRAAVCLDCHYGGQGQGQFITHKVMAAGHPRISFELDLFSTLQQHHDEDADYIARKGSRTNSLRFWAVGQAEALNRSLRLFEQPTLAMDGMFPEFSFFDCHSCHRRIFDGDDMRPTALANPGRPVPPGTPPYNDENMIMLSAVAKVIAPAQAAQFDARARAFHASMLQGRGAAVAAAGALRQSATALADRFAGASFDRAQGFAILDTLASEAIGARFTDYEGAVQSVMALDTLLDGMVNAGTVSGSTAAALRAEINRAYAAVREPNSFQPLAFRRALSDAVRAIRAAR